MKVGSALVPVMAVCWSEGGQVSTCNQPVSVWTPGIMVWGSISYDSRSTLVVIPLTLTANLYVSLVIPPVVLPFLNSIQGGVFQQDNARPHTAVVIQHALQSVDI
ncbi:hypothetical protein AVEN_77329-1 [Araneus ventricosus]|uniref:Tc1-like transposase DDE domain-containing protein n=1 Tax=Araneus ventricosus TaxID=182803 RepID=A0A4Y2DH77_ARAVE|nr:hypothetical protein AVEN_238920-1 [Araneus ventricosus]GBM14986.1 hypothetical protein AVEN_77329-1 [Araneus ventricosus]